MTNDTKKKEDLILNYEIINNKIIIKYIDIYKENEEIQYSKEKELEIVKKIEDTLNNYDAIKDKIKNKERNTKVWIVVSSFILIFNISLLINSLTNIAAWLMILMMGFIGASNVKDINKYKKVLVNLEKSKFYLDNKSTFIKENNKTNVKINTIDKYTLEDLKELKDKLLNENNISEDKKIKKLILKK